MDHKHQIPSGHLCNRCGWPFPNPHPSAKNRRAHKKICGTIDGYTTFITSEDDKEKTPSPKISFSRSEDEVFSDAVTEFSDSGSVNKTLDRDLFFSFKDVENDETSKVDTSVEVSEKIDTHVEKSGETEITTVCDSSESKLELTETGLVKDGVKGHTPEPSHISYSQESKSIDVVEIEEKGQEDAKDSELTKTAFEGSAIVGGDHDNIKQGNFEKLESSISGGVSEGIEQEIKSDCGHVSEAVNEYKTFEETNIKKFGLDYVIAEEVVKESETDHLEGVAEEIKHENYESDLKHAPEFVKESATVQNVSVLTEKEAFGAPNVQIEAHELGKSSTEQTQELVTEPNTVLTDKEDLDGPHLEKQVNEHTHDVVEKVVSVLTKNQDLGAPVSEKISKEFIQEVVKQPDTVLTEKEDLGGPHLEERSNEHNHEVAERPDSILIESQDLGALGLEICSKEHVEEPNLVLTEKEDLGAPKSEECSKDEVTEQRVDNDSSVVADVSIETITQQFSSDNSVVNDKNATVEEGKMNNQDPGAALSVGSSTRSSLEGNWGSISVLSTASIDAGTLQSTEKSKVNYGKSNAATSDVLGSRSFMTLVDPESKDEKPESSEVLDSQKQPNSEVSQAGRMVKVNNESEGRKRNEEAIAKVTNWSTGKQSTRLKNLLGEANSPRGAQPEPMVQKDEALVNDNVSSPPKLIDDDDGKKGRKKVKGLSSWVPFVCCSSVNVVN